MIYNNLGPTNEKISRICLGTMTWGEQNTEQEAHGQLDFAMDQGINFIDTAELYPVPPRKETQGRTEKYIGTWLKKRSDRDQLVIASKVVGPSPNLKYIRDPLKLNKEHIREAIDNSLQRLQTDYVDLYQVHWPERKVNNFGKLDFPHHEDEEGVDDFLEMLETFDDLIREGKMKYFGVSNDTPWGVMRFLQLAEKYRLPRCITIQNPYSLLNRSFEVGLSEIAIREKVGLLAYSPLAFGKLSGKYLNGQDTSNSRLELFADKMTRYNNINADEATQKYTQLAMDHGLSPAQMALAYINSRPFVTANIVGATTVEQLKENIESINVTLSEEVIKEIEKIHKAIPNPTP